MYTFEGRTADEVWLRAQGAFRLKADEPLQPGRGGDTNELLHAILEVQDPRQRWVISRSRGVSVAFAIVEVIGIISGRKDSAYLNFFNPILPRFAGDGPEYHGAYGYRLRCNLGFDQLEVGYRALQANSEGRQVVLQIWDGRKDFPGQDAKPVAPDIPCNICSMLKVRNGRLEWSQVMRSNDFFRGLPYNFVQFMTLQEVMAGWLRVEPGTYCHMSDSLHIYSKDITAVLESKQISVPDSPDVLSLPKQQAAPIWAELNRRVDLLVADDLPAREFIRLAHVADAPKSFSNLMALVSADAARRRSHLDLAEEVVQACDNPMYLQLWRRWYESKKPVRGETVSEQPPGAQTA